MKKNKTFVKGTLFALLLLNLCIQSKGRPLFAEEQAKPLLPASELISLDLRGVDIQELFRMLSLKTGLNIVPTKSVTGRVDLFINNITINDVLEIVLISNDLAKEQSGDIIRIMTVSEYQVLYGKKYNERRKIETLKLTYAKPKDVVAALESLRSDIGKIVTDEASGTLIFIDIPDKIEAMKKMVTELDRPAITEIFELNYAKAEDIEPKISKILTSGAQSLQIDKRTNKIMITELPQKMEEIKKILKEFDEPSKQVMIETDIWEMTLTNAFERGIDWEKIFSSIKDLDFKGTFPMTLTSGHEVSFGTVSRDSYNMVIQFLNSYGRIEILSRPRLAVVNNQEAKIMVGSKEVYVTATLSQVEGSSTTAESVNFVDVGMKLNVVPSIGNDGFITLKIKPEVSSTGQPYIYTSSSGVTNTIPVVSTSEIETTVKIKDGSTLMIAGLIKEKRQEDIVGIPILSKIPIINWFFSSYSKKADPLKKELIICITPRIITGETQDFFPVIKK